MAGIDACAEALYLRRDDDGGRAPKISGYRCLRRGFVFATPALTNELDDSQK